MAILRGSVMPRWPARLTADTFLAIERTANTLNITVDYTVLSTIGGDLSSDVIVAAYKTGVGYRYLTLGELLTVAHTHTLAQISNMSADARTFNAAADFAAMRAALGLGSAALANVGDFAAAVHSHNAAQITDFAEAVDDRVGALVQNGTAITWTYNDAGNTLTPNWTGLPVQKAGAAVATRGILNFIDGTSISVTVADDAGNGRVNVTIALSDAELAAIAGLVSAADRLPYFTGVGTASLATFTAFARTLLDDADAATARATLGAGTLGGALGATDNVALRADGTGGATAQGSPLIIADTTGALSSTNSNTAVPIKGTNTNDNAPADHVGEYYETVVLVGSAVSMTTAVAGNVAQITNLPAGDWDIGASVGFNAAGTPTRILGTVNTVSATAPTSPGGGCYSDFRATFSASANQLLHCGTRRLTLASASNVYLIGYAEFSSTLSCYGVIWARRRR